MSRLNLKIALEEETQPDEPTIKMSGPLAEIYTQALNVAYAKRDNATGEFNLEKELTPVAMEGYSMERMAQDAQALEKVIDDMMDQSTPGNTTIYAVNRSEVTPEVIVDVAQQLLQEDGKEVPDQLIFVVEAPSQPNQATSTDLVTMGATLESLIIGLGGKVFPSLEAYALSLKS